MLHVRPSGIFWALVFIAAGLAGFYFPSGGWGEGARRLWERREEKALADAIGHFSNHLAQDADAFLRQWNAGEGPLVSEWMAWGRAHQCFVFGFSGGRLIFWNTHQYPPIRTEVSTPQLEDSAFGRYIILPAVHQGDTLLVGVIPLTKKIPSPAQQRTIEHPMNQWGGGQWICRPPLRLDHTATLRSCYVSPHLPSNVQDLLVLLYVGLWIAAVFLLMTALPRPHWLYALAAAMLLAWYLPAPPLLRNAGILSAHVFALAPWFNSVFDLMAGLGAMLALWHIFIYHITRLRHTIVRWGVVLLTLIGGAALMNMWVRLLVANSSLSFHFSYFPSLKLHHFFLFGGLAGFFIGWELTIDEVLPSRFWRSTVGKWVTGLAVAAILFAGFTAVRWPDRVIAAGVWLWMAGMIGSTGLFHQAVRFQLPRWLARILPLAIISGILFPLHQQEKEKAQLPLVARKLVAQRSVDEEYLLARAAADLQADPIIRRQLMQDTFNAQPLLRRLENLYLRQPAIRYEIGVFRYTPGAPIPPEIAERFLRAAPVEPSGTVKAFQGHDARTHYFITVPFSNGGRQAVLIIWLQPVSLFEESPYFELTRRPLLRLLDQFRIRDYAIYYRGELIRTYGDYPYPHQLSTMRKQALNDDFRHSFHAIGPDNLVVLSRPRESLWIQVGNYTIPILLLLLWWAIGWLVFLLRTPSRRRLYPQTFRGRLQFYLILMILFMPAGTMIWAPTYLRASFEDTERQRLLITIRKIYQYMQSSPPPAADALSNIEDARAWFYQLGYLMRTDIHLFDYEGHLLITTRPFLFETAILSPLMNPRALYQFRTRLPVHLVIPETIGPLTYLSAYLPIVQSGQTILSYLNISRYVNTTDYDESLNRLVMLFTNISVVLLLVMLLVSMLLTRGLTRPLLLLRRRMAAFRLGQDQDPIQWPHDDEFKILVNTYNRLLNALQASAEALQRAERERTWREIAQQVAHEIKNPLTPMKLRIEQLLRRYDPANPQWQAYFQDTMKMLLHQIDLLNRIAGEFSEYARMPQGIPARIAAHQHIRRILPTFQDTSAVRITTDFRAPTDTIRIDPHHFQQIIINLVKNAIQAIPADRPDGRVVIRTFRDGPHLVIAVEDNGPGIPPDIQPQIFKIRFSTKRKGRGWGLPLVERLVTQAGGRISFSTDLQHGTTFYLRFPIVS